MNFSELIENMTRWIIRDEQLKSLQIDNRHELWECELKIKELAEMIDQLFDKITNK